MKFKSIAIAALSAFALTISAKADVTYNPDAIGDLLDRIAGEGTAAKFETAVDPDYQSADGAEMFKISTLNGKPSVTGTTLSALTTGIGWYLNHYANVNYAWNNPVVDLGDLPLPATDEEHTTHAVYRYYLNYCTFSYSMSTWTWERWQQEIDWMALHGINMPLQIIGLEEVWRQFLMEDCGYSLDEVSDFVAGPSFMAWFGMNNLEGHGGPNPEWWYERQAQLGQQINERMRSLGMEPVLPGFYQVPSNFASKTGMATVSTGNWCSFSRPHLPSVDDTETLAAYGAKYYKRLHDVLGESQYYSMDPFHEGGVGSTDYAASLYEELYNIMDAANEGAQWVIQQWQWNSYQKQSLSFVPKGKLIVLDLNSERVPNYTSYNGHETVFCTIFNFGGRTGFDGRFNGTIDEYFKSLNTSSVKGIGAAPEAIEQTPVAYDMLFELAWLDEKPDAATWMAEYAKRRYSAESADAAEAWELLRTSALNMTDNTQGPHEAVLCGRPNLTINKVSSWGGSDIFYDRADVIGAAYKLLSAKLSGLNYSFDLTDIARQALTDYGKILLAGLKDANDAGDTELFAARRDALLALILDLDELLCSNSEFMLGHWTQRARAMADEVAGTTDSDKDWLELNNARTIITTWGGQAQSESGGLRDYSYREWGGMMKDYYYQRWKTWFDNGMSAPSTGWFQWEWDWAHDTSTAGAYGTEPVGDSAEIAERLLAKYLSKFTSRLSGQNPIYIDRFLTNDYKKVFYDQASPESTYTPDITGSQNISEIVVDLNSNGLFDDSETQTGGSYVFDADAPVGERNVRITFEDGTVLYYTLTIIVEITEPRTVAVVSDNDEQGTVSIVGTDGATSVTNTEVVSLLATAATGYDFDYWTDAEGNNVGNDNPMKYYGKEDATFTAHFVVNKWGVPEYNGSASDLSTMSSYGQYIKTMSLEQGGETSELYSTDSCPEEHFIQIPTRIKAAPGSEFTFNYTEPKSGGMSLLYLSAYVDLNNDGEFNPADGELLGTIGTYRNSNSAVGAGSFTMLLPFDAVKGTTHIRLRFDSSWSSSYDSSIAAVPADAPTNRVIYELILEITDAADFVSEVTVASSNTLLGTVRSENETTNLYAPGDKVILTAFPIDGATKLARWVDNHGRELPSEWMTDNSITFPAYDNAQITAEFEKIPLDADSFTLDWEMTDNGNACITGINGWDGGSTLDLANTALTVSSVGSNAFDDYKDKIQTVVLPNAELLDGSPEVYHSAQIVGDGTENAQTNLAATISGSTSWRMTIRGSNDGSSYNVYGSALFANGTNGLANDYSNGWSQFYVTKAGELDIKWDSATAVQFTGVTLLGDFSIVADFDASAKTLTVTASGSGKSETKVITNSSTMKDISRYVVCVPAGINYTLTITEPVNSLLPGELFAGYTCLENYAVSGTNDYYAVKSGIAYAKPNNKDVVGLPEGRLFGYPFTLESADGKYAGASPLQTGSTLDDTTLGVSVGDMPDNELNAMWTLGYSTSGYNLHHFNSNLPIKSDATALNAEVADGELDYYLVYGDGTPTLALTSGGKYIAHGDEQLALHSDVTTMAISTPVASVYVVAPAKDFTLVLPCNVYVGSDVSAYTLASVSDTEGCTLESVGDVIYANTPVIIRGATAGQYLTFTIAKDGVAAYANGQNLLHGSTVEMTCPGDYYLLNSDASFTLHTSGNIAANSAYLLKSELPAGISDSFELDTQTVNIEFINNVDDSKPQLYDLQGRRVNSGNIHPGIYINSDGVKTLQK